MTILEIELLDPNVRALIAELEKLNLIRIRRKQEVTTRFLDMARMIRSRAKETLSEAEVSTEVDQVREKMQRDEQANSSSAGH